ncbi:MAG: cytochrome c [Nitrospirota bacterium]|nr:cytochrome c [Nitrospirota bacterium]
MSGSCPVVRERGWWWPLLPVALLQVACSAPPQGPPPYDPQAVTMQVLALGPDPGEGRKVFRSWCIFCHGDQQSGEPPTDFGFGKENPRRFRGYRNLSPEEHVTAIVEGFVSAESGYRNMPPFGQRLSPREIADVAAYERQLMALEPAEYWEKSRFSWWPADPAPLPGRAGP